MKAKELIRFRLDRCRRLAGPAFKLEGQGLFDLLGACEALLSTIDSLAAEVERLNAAIRYEQDRSERIGTHGVGCETWGPRHYECLVSVNKAEIARAEAAEAKLSALSEAVREVEAARTNDAMCFAMDGLLIAARAALSTTQAKEN